MPWTNNSNIDALRQAYNAAISAHHGAHRALLDARMADKTPPNSMVEAEAKARVELAAARDRLLAAMAEAIAGHAAAALDPPKTA